MGQDVSFRLYYSKAANVLDKLVEYEGIDVNDGKAKAVWFS